ncbi:transcriptional activator NhaR [Corallococcus sp. AS-1-12]|uniref:transcriptional activator NhaR n=1 Tax=Corallococcus sp. AS-1-12 TaxID=2874598 RepID=UPI001CBABBB5|nr:transcriptional activator NhaR [Corallococcus sp. AS-1-12]MBZ4335558.1 transcriptional activator NhaR [Corallococcus sp. AS-1-12]
MDWFNYHHLLYFWMVAREGGVVAAARKLRLSQPTVTGQVRALEQSLGEKLFERAGRKLVLTEVGRYVYRYADEIFALGHELQKGLKGLPTARPRKLLVGVAEEMPKLIAHRLLEPAMRMSDDVQLICTEDRTEKLLSDLSQHALDLVLSGSPVPPASGIRAYNHLLGECGTTLFATARLASSLRRGFPKSLDGAPFLLLAEVAPSRRSLMQWLEAQGVRPRVRGEFQDSALMKAFGQAGEGVFPGPSVIEAEIRAQYDVEVVGRVDAVREHFYALTVERRLRHPAAVAISDAARTQLFRQP